MASLMCRNVLLLSRRTLHTTSTRLGGYPFIKERGKVGKDDVTVPDPIGHSVGPERLELLARAKGISDPFEQNTTLLTRKSSKEDPFVVPSMEVSRVVGCYCEPDAYKPIFWQLNFGEPQQCMCGHWFKMIKAQPLDVDVAAD